MTKISLTTAIAGLTLGLAVLQYPLLRPLIDDPIGIILILATALVGLILSLVLCVILLVEMIRSRSLLPTSVTRFQLIACFASPIVGAISLFFVFGSRTNIKDLERNYLARRTEIHQVKHFTDAITPPGFTVYVEFYKYGSIDFSVAVMNPDPTQQGVSLFQGWGIDYRDHHDPPPTPFGSSKWAPRFRSLDSVLAILNWNATTLDQIRERLDAADCISVATRDPVEIGYKRSGMGKYSYIIPSVPFSPESIPYWNDSTNYVFYSDSVVFEYWGGAFGSQSFPDFD